MDTGRISVSHRACESGVALRLPPQSKTRADWRWGLVAMRDSILPWLAMNRSASIDQKQHFENDIEI
jgi:hypothetical protein